MPFRKIIYTLMLFSYVTMTVLRLGFPSIFASEISNIRLVELANRDRARQNIEPLKYNKKLERAAYDKAQDMFQKQYWSHFGPDKETPWQFMTSEGYKFAFAGENLAKGFFDSSAVHTAWMNSQAHRDNIMDPAFNEVGIAIVKGKLQGVEVFLVVQMFGNVSFNAQSVRNTNYPVVKITYPKDGDILEDGAFTVRGEMNQLKDDQVNLLLNTEFLQSVQGENKSFEYKLPAPVSKGDVSLEAKGVGIGEEYLSDEVSFKVLGSKINGDDLTKCISMENQVINVVLKYTCQESHPLANMNVQVASMLFNRSENSDSVEIPKSSLPDEFSTFDVTLQFTDGKSNYFKIDRPDDVKSTAILQTSGGLANFDYKIILYVLIGALVLVVVLSLIYSAITRRLSIHKTEAMMMIASVGILLIIFGISMIHV